MILHASCVASCTHILVGPAKWLGVPPAETSRSHGAWRINLLTLLAAAVWGAVPWHVPAGAC